MTVSLIFDTETSGLFNNKLPIGHRDQPEIVQFCGWVDLDGKIVSTVNFFVHGEYPIEEKAYETHRISRELTGAVGITRRRMCMIVDDLAKKADILVGHNVEFDINMLLVAMHREGGNGNTLRSKARFCTKDQSTDICRIPHPSRPGEYKWPTLTEAYTSLVDPRGFENAHDAEADVRACYEVYNVLRARSHT